MKKILFATVFLFALVSTQAQPTKAQKDVNDAVTRLFDGIAAMNMQTVRQNVTEDLMVLESGAIWNVDTLANKLDQMKGATVTRINHIDFIRTEIKGGMAWVAYHNTADITINGRKINKDWLESATLVRDGTRWKVQLLHSTTLAAKNPL